MNKLAASASALLAATVAASATADLVKANYSTAFNYHVKLSHMPDFDQRRDNCCGSPGLPGDGGMYCVPTSTMNMFCYAANHGFPWLDPGPGSWQSNAKYGQANSAIASLGVLMQTDAADGTGGNGWSSGTSLWLMLYSQGLLSRTSVYLDGDTTPTVNGMSQRVAGGSLVAFAYGRYNVIGSYQGHPKLTRTGGHAVTYTEAFRNSDTFYLRYRDPADDPADATQSTFINKQVTITPRQVVFDWDPTTVRNVHVMDYPSDDGKYRIVDGYVAIKPVWFLNFINTGGTYSLVPMQPLSFGGAAPASTPMGTIFGVRDMELELEGNSALALVEASAIAFVPKLRRYDLAEHTYVDLPMTGLRRFVTGPDGRIYAHDGLKVMCYRPDGTLEGASSSIPTPTALAFDDVNKHLVIMSIPERKITRLTAGLAHVGTFIVPTPMPMSGDGSVIVNPLDQHVLFFTGGSNQIGEVTGLGPTFTFAQHTVPGLPAPKALSPSDDGRVFVSTADGLRVLVKTTGWAIDPSSPFHDMEITGRMASLRSRTNVNPALHDTPGWLNILPDDLLDIGFPVPDCTGDVDGNDLVDGADLGRLLANWGSADPNSDLNADGVVNGADLGLLLSQWGPCL